MLRACVLLLITALAVAQESYSDTWKELYTLRPEPGTTTLQNAAWVWSQINSGAEVSFNATEIVWPTSDGDWILASRFLEEPCTTNPYASLCVAVCSKVPSWEYVSASEWDFCVHVQPERCTARIPGWEMPGNRLCWDQYRPHDQANNPLCPAGFISGSVNGSRPETMELWCGEVANASAISVVPGYKQVLASSPWDTSPAVVTAIEPALVHDLPPPHKKYRFDRASGNMVQCSLSEMAVGSQCQPVFNFMSDGWPSSYCTSLCGPSTVPAANVLDDSLSATADVCCYSAGCKCTPISEWAEVLEPGSTPFCLLADTITPSYTGGVTQEWWNKYIAKSVFMSVAYRAEDAKLNAPQIGTAPNGLPVWLIKAWAHDQSGVTESNTFCGRGAPGEVHLCSAWGIFAGKCLRIDKLMSFRKREDQTWELLKDNSGQPVPCASYQSNELMGPASNTLMQDDVWCYRSIYQISFTWYCWCFPPHSMVEYNDKTDRVSSCSTQSAACMPATSLISEPTSDPASPWSARCYVSQNDGSMPCSYTRSLKASNTLSGTSMHLCAVRAWSPAPFVTADAPFKGNWKDQTSDRALPHQTASRPSMSLYVCQTQCLQFGQQNNLAIKYCGLTATSTTTECWCGTASDNYQKHGSQPYNDNSGAASFTYSITGSGGISVYEIQGSLPDMDTAACRPARSYTQWQPVAVGEKQAGSSTLTVPLCQNWPCNGCGKWGGEGQTNEGCGSSQYGGNPGDETCTPLQPISNYRYLGTGVDFSGDRDPIKTVIDCSGFVAKDPSADTWGSNAHGQGQAFMVPPRLEPCSSGLTPRIGCWWSWEMFGIETYVTNVARTWNEQPDANYVQWSFNSITRAINLCGPSSAYDSNNCPTGYKRAGNTGNANTALCVSDTSQAAHNSIAPLYLCYPTVLLAGTTLIKAVPGSFSLSSVGTGNSCFTNYYDPSAVKSLCSIGWSQWPEYPDPSGDSESQYPGVFGNPAGNSNGGPLLAIDPSSITYSWASGTEGVPSGGWGTANAEQQQPRGFSNTHITCGGTSGYGNSSTFDCTNVWITSNFLVNPPAFVFDNGLLWPTSFSSANGLTVYTPSQLRSSVDPDAPCIFRWDGICQSGYTPATNDATMTLCCKGFTAMCRCYPSSYTQREGLSNVGRTDSRWGAFSAQSQAAMCTPSTGIENPSPVCPTLPRWCLDLQHQPCASSCALGNQLSNTQQGEAYVACIRSNCNATALSGSSGSFADCNYGWYCQSSMYNKCEGCSTFNEQLKLYNRTSTTYSCQKLPSPYGGMMPVGLAGSRSEVAQPMQSPVQCGANTFATAGRYCQPCPVNHHSGAGASYCQACAAGTSRMYRYDWTSALASASWSCVLDPSNCQLASPGSCEACQEGWQSNQGGLCVDCPGAYTLNPSWLGSTELAVAAGVLACIGCPRGQIRRLSTSECVNCGSHEHIVRILPSAGTRLTFQEQSRYGIATYILPDAESHGIFESLFCDFSGSCPAGTAIVPTHYQFKYCAACPPGMTGINCAIVCPYNHYNPEWGNSKCFQCSAGTHAPVANHNRQILQDLFGAVPVWAGARYCETSFHPPNSPSGMVVPRDTAYSTGWQEGALLNAAGFQTLSDPQACVRSCVETEQCLAISWTASNGACRMSTVDTYTQLSSGTNTWIKKHAVTLSVAPPPPPASCLNLTYLTPAPVPADIRTTVATMLQNGTLLPTNKTAFPPSDNWNLQQIWLSVAPQDIELCTPCPAGSFGPPVSTGGCFPCPPFAFSSTAGSTQCTLCPINTYTEVVGSTACLPCPENTNTRNQTGVPCRFSNGTIATPPQGDEFCVPGSRLVGAVYDIQGKLVNLTCTQCGAGRYSTEYDQVTCQLCPPGQTNNAQHTGCRMCTNNTFSTQGICNECAANTIASTSHASCDPCPLGQGRNLGEAACSNCTDPYYNAMLGGGCGLCPTGYQSFRNHTACYKCRSGFGRDVHQTQCTPCPAGQYSDTASLTAGCQYCPRNHISDRAGQSSCVRCSRAEVSNKVVGGTKCVSPFYQDLLFLESMSRLEQILAGMGVLFALFLLLRRPQKQKQI